VRGADLLFMRRTTRTLRLALASVTVTVSIASVGAIATPVAASPTPTTTPTNASGQYVVKQGDSLFGIAKKLGVSLNALLASSGLKVDSMIHPGMTITVPTGSLGSTSSTSSSSTSSATTSAPATTYVVQPNDALYNIARRHGVSLNGLLQANKLSIDSVVFPGRTLTIPAGGTLVVSPTSAASGQATSSPSSSSSSSSSSSTAPAGSYIIRSGDSIFAIAAKHGLKMGPLMKANNLTIASVLIPGRTLTIPAGGTLVVSPTSAASGQASSTAAASAAAAKIDTVVAYAKAQLGKPWIFAASGPDAFDCSGLTMRAYQQIGINLPHSSVMQSTRGTAVDWYNDEIQAGDLIFMASTNAPGVIGHVGIAIDSKRWVHSPEFGDVVRQGFIPADDRLMAVRRFVTG
jgi:LysM repeat protein